jgi:repressor of nif and glnA expression
MNVQVDKYVQQDLDRMSKELALDCIAEIPIYTNKNPNPKSGKPDCNITRMEKEHFRTVMKMKLQAANTDEERQKVIDHYKSKWSDG